MNRSRLWTICRVAVLLIVILIFTPLVIPAHVSEPAFLGMPYTLWMGLVVSFLMLALTIFGSWVHPGRDQ